MAIAGLEAIGANSPDFPRGTSRSRPCGTPTALSAKGRPGVMRPAGRARRSCGWGSSSTSATPSSRRSRPASDPRAPGPRTPGPPTWEHLPRHAGALHAPREARPRSAAGVHRAMPPVRRQLREHTRRRRRPGRHLHGHDRHLLASPLERPAAGRRDGRLRPLVNGDFTGWEGDKQLWSARDGMLVGHSPGLDHNEFLATTRPYGDFILSLNFRMVDGKGNSGVQFRSVRIPGHEMSGYQADIGEGYWGSLYDESRRNKVLVAASAEAVEGPQQDRLEPYVVRAMGDAINLSLNGKELGALPRDRYRASPATGCWRCRFTRAGRWRSSSRTC